MTTSGSTSFCPSLDQIRRDALSDLGISNPSAGNLEKATFKLNLIKNQWQNRGIFLWERKDVVIPMTGLSAGIALDASIIDVEDNAFFRQNGNDYPGSAMSRTNYKQETNKNTPGIPNRFYIDYQLANPIIYFWPYWNYATGVVTGTDGFTYLCIADHTSAAANRPITGTNYATYWQVVSAASPNKLTAAAWANATAYYSGQVWVTANVRMQDFVSTTDNSDAPVNWCNALVTALRAELAPSFGKNLQERQKLDMDAERAFMIALGGQPGSGDLRVFPDFR